MLPHLHFDATLESATSFRPVYGPLLQRGRGAGKMILDHREGVQWRDGGGWCAGEQPGFVDDEEVSMGQRRGSPALLARPATWIAWPDVFIPVMSCGVWEAPMHE